MKQVIRYDLKKLGDICCDNPKCDYVCEGIGLSAADRFIGANCPKCGENLLTQDGYDRTIRLLKIVDSINHFCAKYGLGSEKDEDFDKDNKITVRTRPDYTDIQLKLKR